MNLANLWFEIHFMNSDWMKFFTKENYKQNENHDTGRIIQIKKKTTQINDEHCTSRFLRKENHTHQINHILCFVFLRKDFFSRITVIQQKKIISIPNPKLI